jgi:hypothetical protein
VERFHFQLTVYYWGVWRAAIKIGIAHLKSGRADARN